MEFEAISNGKKVRAGYNDLVQAASEEGERVLGMGETPYEVIYQDDEKKRRRTVDLRDIATASGLEKVDFKFNRDKAIEMGLMSKDADVDQGDVYNLERIKTEEGRMKYLTDKGFAGILRDGDSYYATKNGSIVPINATVGIGVDDVTRIAASGGQMVGSAAAIGAVGGASIVTGGAVLAGVTAAGAAGGVVGEVVQRGADKLFGADAAQYNAELGASEEAMAFGKAGAMGAVDAVGGQVIGRAVAGAKQGASALLQKAAGALDARGMTPAAQWAEGKSAQLQMSALEQRLPSGVFARQASAEEAAAQTLLQQGSQKGVTSATKREAANTASGLMDGSMRRAAVQTEEEVAQQAILRQQAEEIGARAAKEKAESFTAELAKKTGRTEAQVAFEEKMKDTSREVFGGKYAKELDEVFKEGGSKEAADAAREAIEKDVVDRFAKQHGIKVQKDPVSGAITGVDQESMRGFLSKTVDTTFNDASEFIRASKTAINPGDIVPPAAVKQETISTLNSIGGSLKAKEFGELKSSVSSVVSAIKGHTEDAASQARLRDAINALEERVRSDFGSQGMKEEAAMALRRIEEATSRYQVNATSNVEGLQQVLNIQSEYMTMRKMAADGVLDQGGGTSKFMEGMQTLEKLTGDSRATNIRSAISALDLESTLRGAKSDVRQLMEPGERAYADAFQFVRLNTIEKATGETAKAENKKRLGLAGAAGTAEGVSSGSVRQGVVTGALAYAGLRGGVAEELLSKVGGQGLAGGAAAKAKSIAQSAKQGAKALATGAANIAKNPVVQAQMLRQATGAEEALSYQPKTKAEERSGRLVSR